MGHWWKSDGILMREWWDTDGKVMWEWRESDGRATGEWRESDVRVMGEYPRTARFERKLCKEKVVHESGEITEGLLLHLGQ